MYGLQVGDSVHYLRRLQFCLYCLRREVKTSDHRLMAVCRCRLTPSILHVQVDVQVDPEYFAVALVGVRLGFFQDFYQSFLVDCVQQVEIGFQVSFSA
jgi:hypothetical protein